MTFTVAGTALGRTLGDWCDDLLAEYLDPHAGVELDQLAEALTPDATSLSVDHGASGLRAQARVELGDELLFVWGPDSTPNSWQVARGWDGTTAAIHLQGGVLRVNPRWPRIRLAQQLNREIRSWPAAVCAVVAGDFSLAAGADTVDLDGLLGVDVRRVLRVQRANYDVSDTSWPTMPFVLERNQYASSFGSGYALRFPSPPGMGTTVRVAVGVGFLTPDPDFAADLGTAYLLTDRLADAAMLGVAGRLLLTSETARTDGSSQPRARVAEDVPPGHKMQAGEALLALRDKLLKLEVEDILNGYGIRG